MNLELTEEEIKELQKFKKVINLDKMQNYIIVCDKTKVKSTKIEIANIIGDVKVENYILNETGNSEIYTGEESFAFIENLSVLENRPDLVSYINSYAVIGNRKNQYLFIITKEESNLIFKTLRLQLDNLFENLIYRVDFK